MSNPAGLLPMGAVARNTSHLTAFTAKGERTVEARTQTTQIDSELLDSP